jgi:S-adenosylmethionine uptake transporter
VVAGALSYSTLAFSALLGALLFSERLQGAAWAGIALIVASGVLAMQRGRG